MENCLFCKIVAGQIPAKIVYQDADVVAFEDINPQAPQHVLLKAASVSSRMSDQMLDKVSSTCTFTCLGAAN